MSDPILSPANGWTPNQLKVYIDTIRKADDIRLNDLRAADDQRYNDLRAADDLRYEQLRQTQSKAVDAALAAAALAMDKALETSTARFNAIDMKLEELRASQVMGAGRSGGLNAGWAYLVGFVAVAAVVINLIISLTQ